MALSLLPLFGLLFAAYPTYADFSTGALPDLSPPKGRIYLANLAAMFKAIEELPSAKDNRGFLGPAKHQGYCGSCVTFAAHGLLEASIAYRYGLSAPVTLAEQLTLDCTAGIIPNYCEKGALGPAILNILVDVGATNSTDDAFRYLPLATKKYVPQITNCINLKNSLLGKNEIYPFRPLVWEKLQIGSANDIKILVDAYGAVMATFNSGKLKSSELWGTDIAEFGDGPDGLHEIVVVGWDDDKQSFLVRNSWGSSSCHYPHLYPGRLGTGQHTVFRARFMSFITERNDFRCAKR